MGKGDKKSKRGKIIIGSFGVRRLRNKNKKALVAAVKAKDETIKAVVKEEEAFEAVAETVAKPKVVKEKAPAKEKKEAKTEKTVKAEKQAKEPKAKKEKKAE